MDREYIISGTEIVPIGKVLKNAVKDDPGVTNAIHALNAEKKALQNNGINEPLLDWILVQDYMESGAYSNRGYRSFNNPGNIMWPAHGLPYGKKGGFDSVNHSYYASFPNLDTYVKEKIRVLNQAPGYPLQATSSQDFVNRLKQNNYFGSESAASYYTKMKGAAQRINLLHDFGKDLHQDIVTDAGTHQSIKEWWNSLPPWEKIAVGAAGALGLVVIINATK